MALSFLDNVDYRGKKPNFTRDLFETVADMVAFSENYLPDVFITSCKEGGKIYVFNRDNTVDTTLGKWRELQGGSEVGDWDSLIGRPFKDIDGNVFTVDENGVLSVVIPEVPIEKISVNGTEIEPTDKVVDIIVPTVSAEGGNQIEEKADGLYVPAYDDTTLSEKIEEKLDAVQSVDNAGKFLVVGDDGTVTFAEPSAASGDSAENIAYVNADYSQYSNVDLALDALFAKVYYVKPTCSLSASPTGGTFEMGTTITAPITFTWTTNKPITTQTLTNCTLADETVRTATYDTDISSDKTFTLSVSDGENSATSSVSYKFMNKIHFGCSVEPATYDSSFILGLANGKLASSNKATYSFDCGDGEYAYFATPTSLKIVSAWVNGFQADLEEVASVNHTNASGYTTSYVITRFRNASLGSFSAEVK